MTPSPEAVEISRRMIDAGIQAFRHAVQAEKLVGDISVHERALICVRVYKAMEEARRG